MEKEISGTQFTSPQDGYLMHINMNLAYLFALTMKRAQSDLALDKA